jgi:PHD/YefM family antitoxin component YafN of YafNO toxin-antitoxin module
MNIVTVADIKRSGFAVLEAALARGPVHLMKRNRPSAVLLRPAEYDQLLQQAQRNSQPPRTTALGMLLNPESIEDGLDAAAMRSRLVGLHEGWGER